MIGISTVVWDWNGTLLDDVGKSIESMNPLLVKRGLPTLTLERYLEAFRFPVKKYYESIGFDFSKESFDVPAFEFMDNYRRLEPEMALTADCIETLKALKERGLRQYVLSAMEQSLLEKMIAQRGINRYLDGIFGLTDDFAKEKISAGKRMIDNLKIDSLECVMVGDTVHDAEVAEACGFRCVLYSRGHSTRERLLSTGLPVIDSLSELLTVI